MKYTNRLRGHRAERRTSQIDLAIAAGIPRFRYWQIENGYMEPTDEEKAALARELQASVGDLFPVSRVA